jgi:aromatic ring-cleaving dioxygenase
MWRWGGFTSGQSARIRCGAIRWLALNRGELDVFVHPNTGNGRADHSAHVMFLGKSYPLDLSIFSD